MEKWLFYADTSWSDSLPVCLFRYAAFEIRMLISYKMQSGMVIIK